MSLGPREARHLFEAISDGRKRKLVFDAILAPAMSEWSSFGPAFARYRRLASSAPPPRDLRASIAPDLWTFYALSRVFEWLTLGFQDRGESKRARHAPVVSRDEIVAFFGALGMDPITVEPVYHPFFHEVVAAEPDAALGDAILVEDEVWPGLWFGDMIFARAGVRVRCGPAARFDPALAARSTLYFAWTRLHRPTLDLSHGWGSGSQWATCFRRDYVDGAVLRYNVDGRIRLTPEAVLPSPESSPPDPGGALPPAERIELLTHRCPVWTPRPDQELWPFDDTYAEPVSDPAT